MNDLDSQTAPMRGRFITFEGIDGAGKSTHIEACCAYLRAQLEPLGQRVIATREPGGTPLAERLRELVLHESMDLGTETLLMFAARNHHLHEVIRPALAAGHWVVCDRFTDATYAYQGIGRGLGSTAVSVLESWVHGDLQPTRTYWFDVAPELAANRRQQRAGEGDRFEQQNLHFFNQVRQGYLNRAELDPKRILRLDASQPIETVRAAMMADLATWVNRSTHP